MVHRVKRLWRSEWNMWFRRGSQSVKTLAELNVADDFFKKNLWTHYDSKLLDDKTRSTWKIFSIIHGVIFRIILQSV